MQKLYCYVDESGQDTEGEISFVSIVITGTERDGLHKRNVRAHKVRGISNQNILSISCP